MAKPTNAAIVDLNGRKWTPFESLTPSGHVTYTERAGDIHVPYGTDPISLTIQAHELSHVRYSAKVWPDLATMLPRLSRLAGTTYAIVGYAEDMRITALAGRLGIKTLPAFGNSHDKPIIDGWVESFVAAGIPKARVLKAAQFILTQHTAVLAKLGLSIDTLQVPTNAERYIVAVAQHIHKLLSRGEADSDKSQKGEAKKSEGKSKSEPSPERDKSDESDKSDSPDKSDDSEADDTDESGEGDESSEGDSASAKGDSEGDSENDNSAEGDSGADSESDESESDATSVSGDASGGDGKPHIDLSDVPLPDIKAAMLDSVPAPVDTAKLVQTFQHTLDNTPWVPVAKINRVPLVRRAVQARRKGRKLSEVGVALGSAYDAVSPNERRPFVAKRKGGAGDLTVLIDCSGSMYIDERQMETLLLKHPQGVVVTYASHIAKHGRGAVSDSAEVRVIASHGRLAATKDFRDIMAGGNGCDGPVLEWLAKQSGERVWICDGQITQQGDAIVPYSHDTLAAWLKAHRITQFYTLNAYLESLT